ncbi:DUF3857 domain-containing protein [Chitinophaga oryziterrae]|uniref:DUF3857 domain-containing protein n=1 Tax=Chitinophaga oryziterrae TaxID=1031224 RepID=A0A6N8J391_9BACT|nr:DUF3857 domain-containing protein [Chitinophaga oryziterrae]MVT39640.1 DUF3857 domain-containing protein [Chitinophaga oryziterrae]
MRVPICTLLCLLCCTLAFSQINRYVNNTWETQPQLHHQTDTSVPVTLLKFIVARDFNRPTSDGSHCRTIYKRIHINTQKAADSISQLIIPLEPYESIKSVDARVIYPDGHIQGVPVLKIYAGGKAETIRIAPLKLVPGCEVEYDMLIYEATTWAGFEYMQSTTPCNEATFMLVLPPNVLFRTRGSNGFPDVRDSIASNGIHYFHATAYHIPALLPGDLFYYNTWLQRTEFSLRETTWEQPAKDQFLQYVYIEKPEYKKLEKEVSRWEFLKTRSPLPVLIYQVEQQIKSQYKLIDDPDNSDLSDINAILRTKTCNETGIVKLMASVYYLLGIHTQILFTSGKESVPLDSSIVNIELASNVLIYFPELRQALAPAAADTRFPFYPASWTGIMALRCRDTLIDKKAEVLVDFIRTPVSDYTKNNISLEANIDINNLGVNDVKLKQTAGGYPGMAIKTIIGNTLIASLDEQYNSMLPTGPIRVSGLTHKMQNGYWDQPVADAPFILESSFKTDSINIGMLINGLVQQYVSMPPVNIPVEMAFPFYQESRIYITVPEGYKMANTADYIVDIPGTSLGYKITCKQEGNKITIYALKWFKKSSYNNEEKKVFGMILQADNEIKNKRLYISKS